ncbi:DUF4251 domain-containing protein [Chitinophaga japonensis]|uniref:Uncharacterized protein DUF4251 n=1 Tax=Chitinophaga japonensis TaxID=104662 RepID=A0A562T8P9_CHIJA|nr:DUF4251 domain-containing protein [Chitinophaga japonensis]TWI89306.1 uncharacterized protein DUF4251 [Chitinophaga japonensis]
MRKLLNGTICLLIALASAHHTFAQDDKKDQIKEAIAARSYVFKAQTVLPMGGRSRQLTTQYDVKVAEDSVLVDLPYFGRAYTAPLDPTKGGFRFKTKDFEYTVDNKRKGGWNIVIQPRDTDDARQLALMISEDGYGTLQVISNNRQPISFNGYVTAREPRKER